MPAGPWNEAMLDSLLEELEASFDDRLRDDEGLPEELQSHQVLGYFLYRLADCKPGTKIKGPPPATIEGPLFGKLVEGVARDRQ